MDRIPAVCNSQRVRFLQKQSSMIKDHDLCERAFRYAVDVSKLCIRLQERGPVVRRLSMKLLDSGTSIGANLEEGRAGQSKPDFIAKNFISLKEARETRFWLRVIAATDPPLERELQPFLQEANEFIAMLTATLKTARSSPARGVQNLQRVIFVALQYLKSVATGLFG